MVRLRYSGPSINDIKSIFDFIAFDSQYYAKQFVRDIKEKIKTLKKYPEQGRVLQSDRFIGLRQLLFKNYRIIYTYKNNIVDIISVHHQSRDLNNIESLKPFEI